MRPMGRDGSRGPTATAAATGDQSGDHLMRAAETPMTGSARAVVGTGSGRRPSLPPTFPAPQPETTTNAASHVLFRRPAAGGDRPGQLLRRVARRRTGDA